MADDPTADARARQADQIKEYGAFVAVAPIDIDGARAFNPGDPVPASHVERGVVDVEAVAKVNTKAAKAVTEPEG